MFTSEQEQWIAHLSDTDTIRIIPYDPNAQDIFERVQKTVSDDWKNLIAFETCLKENPETLDRYRILKESGNGLSVREYYRRKIAFLNEILERIS